MKINSRLRVLLIIALVSLVIGSYYNYYLVPKIDELKRIKSSSETLANDIYIAKTFNEKIDAIEHEVDTLEKKAARFKKSVPSGINEAQRLDDLEEILIDKAEDIHLGFSADVYNDEYINISSVSVSSTTSYKNLLEFLTILEEAKYSNRVQSLNITTFEPEEDSLYDVNVNYSIDFFTFDGVVDYTEKFDFLDGEYDKKELIEIPEDGLDD